MKNKNIAFLIANIDNGGGTERVSLALADFLCEKGYNVTFFSYQAKGKPFFEYNPKIRIIGFSHNGWMIRLLRHVYPTNDQLLHFLIKYLGINVIIDVDMGQAIYSSAAIQGTKCKQITWDHFNYYETLKNEVRRQGLECCKSFSTKFVVLTQADKEAYITNENLKTSFIEQIYNPITIDATLPTHTVKKKNVIAIGRLERQKGFDLLLHAWSKIEPSHSDWILDIYGVGSEESDLRKLALELNLHSVNLKGRTDDIKSKLAESSIFALSSRFEGFGLVLTEAEAMGLPIVSFDCPMGPSEIVVDGRNGFLVTPDDIETFAEKLKVFIENEELRSEFGRESIIISQKFDKDRVFQKWLQLLNSI